jgi:hypothetical protein
MKLAADMGRHSGRAPPSLHDTPYRQFKEATGRRSTYPLPIPVQTNRATSVHAVPSASDITMQTILRQRWRGKSRQQSQQTQDTQQPEFQNSSPHIVFATWNTDLALVQRLP